MSRRILVVDDEANARNGLAELLRDEGFEVETAAHGREALAKLAAYRAQVVITELQMPGIAGSELVTRLLERANPPSVIVMTPFTEKTRAVEAIHAGAEAYLTTPLHFDELLGVLGGPGGSP